MRNIVPPTVIKSVLHLAQPLVLALAALLTALFAFVLWQEKANIVAELVLLQAGDTWPKYR